MFDFLILEKNTNLSFFVKKNMGTIFVLLFEYKSILDHNLFKKIQLDGYLIKALV